ncbi:hypothetical protein N0V90_001231 [Kalmusia sp. IMI 367209]|nr:hypothetical protein N0V90_001231 [Kalmusia sp. IMI 367209]
MAAEAAEEQEVPKVPWYLWIHDITPEQYAEILESRLTEDVKVHKRCNRLAHDSSPPIFYTQRTLASKNGSLALSPRPPPARAPRSHHPCTPAPNAVRRCANTPTFSTNDARLTTFLRFPAEIRVEIYKLLLIQESSKTVQYQVCPSTLQLVLRTWGGCGHPRPWIRHFIFPSILRCCRTTHREGTPILYAENWFSVEMPNDYLVVRSWPLPRENLEKISKVHFRPLWWGHGTGIGLRNQLNQCELFAGLKEVRLECRDVGSHEVIQFLRDGVERKLDEMKIAFEFRVTRGYREQGNRSTEAYLRDEYREVIEALGEPVWGRRLLVEEFEEYEDDEGSEFDSQDLAMLKLILK